METTSIAGQKAARVRQRKRRRRLLINITAIIVILLIAAIFLSRRGRSNTIPGLVMDTAQRMDLVQTVSATGSVTAQTGAMVKIGSQITGRIKRLYADVGSIMKAGEVIAELDVPDLEAQVRQVEAALSLNRNRLQEQLDGLQLQQIQTATELEKARSGLAVAKVNLTQVERSANLQLAAAEASVRQAKANDTNSSANYDRVQQLYAKGYVAASDVDSAKAQAEVNKAQLVSTQENLRLVRTKLDADLESARQQAKQAEATLAAAQAGLAQNAIKRQQIAQARDSVKQSEANLSQVRFQLDKAFIRSPISGTVLQLAQQEGETIAAGLSAPTLIIVADLNRLQVDAFVDETDIGRVKLGQNAEIIIDAYPNRPFHGRVTKIASGATMQQNVVTYDVTIAVDNPKGLLKPDMTATANITVAKLKNVLAVPIDAVQTGMGGSTVTIMTPGPGKQPQYRPAPVKTGINDGEHTQILEGLKEGDTVVVSGQVPGREQQAGMPRFGPFGPMGGPRRGGGGGRGGG